MRYYEICLRPLTRLHPLYTGSITPLEPNIIGLGSIMPTAWTIAGATLNILAHQLHTTYDDLTQGIEDGHIELSGPYMLDENLLKREPKEPRTIVMPIQGIPGPHHERKSATPYFKVIQALHVPSKGIGLAIVEVTGGEANLKALLEVKAVFSERVGISLSTRSKTVIEGMIYSYRGLEDIKAVGQMQALTNIHYCAIVRTEKRISREKAQGIIDFGGKNSVAKYIAREISHDPFIKIDNYNIKLNKPFLAASHIHVRKLRTGNGKILLTPGCHRVEAVLGKIAVVYGWDYMQNRIKDPLLTLTPGSIIELEQYNNRHHSGSENCDAKRKWYYKILTSAVKINI